MSVLGHKLRLSRIIDPATSTSVIMPMDHAIEEPDFTELERPSELIRSFAQAGVDSFIMRRGMATFGAEQFGAEAGWIERMTGRTGFSQDHNEQLVLASVEQALANGACGVVPTFFLGEQTEGYQLTQLGRIADECAHLGMPLMTEIFPVGVAGTVAYDGPYSVEEMRIAVRVASEEGADVIKTYYTGDPESFARVVDYALAPVIVAGGQKTNNVREVFEMAHGAKAAGAVGIAMGRKVWQSPDPLATLAGLKRIIREDATVDHAMECVEAGAGASA
jgi:fructose-bisphosphate aldolase/2-amino-3,7-dideoxy-D-threo-hept-6-ulosonate synthase